jgi:hypothetical protein
VPGPGFPVRTPASDGRDEGTYSASGEIARFDTCFAAGLGAGAGAAAASGPDGRMDRFSFLTNHCVQSSHADYEVGSKCAWDRSY